MPPPMQAEADLQVDYLVVGAGAAGMAFTDRLLAGSDATVAIVDRRHAPGGHWIDAYPYVRLHQPSSFYGVDSVPLGADSIDQRGTNAGYYELAGASELSAYFERVMHRHFLPTGRVRYFPSSDYLGDGRFVSRLTGESRQVRVRRRLIDTSYLEGSIPATSPPPFALSDGVRCIPAGELARLAERPDRFVIIGGGKTALDTCVWLLEQNVPPDAIRWIRPRDAWWLNRRFQQPHTLVPDLYRGVALQIQAIAEAGTMRDIFTRLESEGVFLRIDPAIEPSMFRGAVISESELALLRQIEDVVRLGHVRSISRTEIVLTHGTIPTNERTLHVHCAARGLSRPPLRPIFEPGRVSVQPFMWGFACFQFALLGTIETLPLSDDEKNWLCAPIAYWDVDRDYLAAFVATLIGDRMRAANPTLASFAKTSRLNPVSGVAAHRDDPRVIDARERIKRHGAAAVANLQRLLAER